MKCKSIISIIVFSILFLDLNVNSISFASDLTSFNDPKNQNHQPEIVPGIVVIKLTSTATPRALAKGSAAFGISSLDTKLRKYNVLSVEKMFRHKPIPANSNIPDISRIMKMQIPEDINPLLIIRELSKDPSVEYAEPVYKRWFLDVPNDPKYPDQDYLPQIKAPEAWDIQKGDSNVVIAIVDGGVDLEHEDLKANLWVNEPEANGLTGVDDDGNGYIDDIHGWDFEDDDSDPTNHPENSHGTACAGIACAVTNNNIGVSGVGWSCKFMPVKAYTLGNGYQGIKYAADNGADVISNSWGGYGYSQWEQDLINYAYSKGSIVVCAAGNEGTDIPLYPTAYQHSISVAAVRTDDVKIDYSTFGPAIDISAPSTEYSSNSFTLLTTYPDNKYDYFGGTSGACPVVAGVCGLVKSYHPDWTNDQIIRQALLSADNLDQQNPSYVNQLGHGRVNAFRALTETDLPEPDARFSVFSYELSDSVYGDNDSFFETGETILLKTVLKNHSIGQTNTASFSLTCSNPTIEIINGNFSNVFFRADTTLPFEFSFKINENIDTKKNELKLLMQTGNGYSREETIPVIFGTTPVLFVDHDMNNFYTEFHSESFYLNILEQNEISFTYWDCLRFGIPDSKTLLNYPIVIISSGNSPSERFNKSDLKKIQTYLDHGGNLFISGPNIGFDLFESQILPDAKEFMRNYLHAEYVTDKSNNLQAIGVSGDPIGHGLSFDIWQPYWPSEYQRPDVIKPTEGASTIFTYGNGQTGAIKYSGDHKVVYLGFGLESIDSDAYTELGDMSPVRTEVLIRALDWLDWVEHDAQYDSSSNQISFHAEITDTIADLNSVWLFWKQKETEISYDSLEMSITDSGYYCQVSNAFPDTGKGIEYYIQLEYDDFTWKSPYGAPAQISPTHIRNFHPNVVLAFDLSQNYPNPFNPTTVISYQLPVISNVELTIYNLLGQKAVTLVSKKQPAGNYKVEWDASDFASGIYFYRLQTDKGFVQTKKLILLR